MTANGDDAKSIRLQSELEALRAELKVLKAENADRERHIQQIQAEIAHEREKREALVNSIQQEMCAAIVHERKMMAACFLTCRTQHKAFTCG